MKGWRHVWRLGHVNGPCDFIPRHLCSWNNRFDDPRREYRTLYSADNRLTCLREILADLRPKENVLQDFEKLFGPLTESERPAGGFVSIEWRRAHVLIRASIIITNGSIADIEDKETQRRLSQDLANFLHRHGIKKLGGNELRGRTRAVTQAVSRHLFEQDGSGVQFRSRLDELLCFALFEGRTYLEPISSAVPMSENDPDLLMVCREYRLTFQN